MKIKLVKLSNLSGGAASIYSIWYEEHKMSSLDIFVQENINSFKSELNDIIIRLKTMGSKTGAREHFFKINEGIPGDGVCALYDDPDKNLRLYCIRYGTLIVIIGGGGPKNVDKLQQDPKLKSENYLLRDLSSLITARIKTKEIKYTKNQMDFTGNLEFNIEL